MSDLVPMPEARALTAKQFSDLADVPPELEWLPNIANLKTKRTYIRVGWRACGRRGEVVAISRAAATNEVRSGPTA